MGMIKHQKRLLLVEDNPGVARSLQERFEQRGYYVATARSYEQARNALEADHFHVAVVDLKLDNPSVPENTDGLLVLRYITDCYPEEAIKKIVVTAEGTTQYIIEAFEQYHVFRFIEKQEGYQRKVLEAVENSLRELRLNFDLVYEIDSHELIPLIAEALKKDRELNAAPVSTEVLGHEVEDLFGKLFAPASKIYLQNTITQGMTASFVVRVLPTFPYGAGTTMVVKMGRADKIKTEADNCRHFVEPLLQANAVRLMADGYMRHIGGICYTLTANDLGRGINEFDRLYSDISIPAERISGSIKQLFDINLKNWYHDKREWDRRNLIDLYLDAFNLRIAGRHKLERLYSEFETFFDRATLLEERLELRFEDGTKRFVTNPLQWLERHDKDCRMRIELNITHGDLTGRNIMADNVFTEQRDDENQTSYAYHKFYLIDFFRTRESHTLRDLVIFETDLKYRLYMKMGVPALAEFEKIEWALLAPPNGALRVSAEGERLYSVLRDLREIGAKLRRLERHEWMKEYLVSILMATLNVVRLSHIEPERKKQAILSASMICDQLEKLMPRRIETGALSPTQPLTPLTPEEYQYKHLAKLLFDGRIDLFIGRSISDAGNPKHLAEQLAGEIPGYRLRPEDSFRYVFSLYRQTYDRAELVSAHVKYFQDAKQYPAFFDLVARLNWRAVFTTNQHNYLERACYALKRYSVEIVNPSEKLPKHPGPLIIHKMYGSLSAKYREEPQTLPLTQDEYQLPEAEERVRAFQQRIQYDLSNGVTLLMLYPSSRDIMTVRRWLNFAGTTLPEVYVVIPDEANQIEKRNLEQNKFKVLMVEPLALLQNLEKLCR